jgi:hypothetical protein
VRFPRDELDARHVLRLFCLGIHGNQKATQAQLHVLFGSSHVHWHEDIRGFSSSAQVNDVSRFIPSDWLVTTEHELIVPPEEDVTSDPDFMFLEFVSSKGAAASGNQRE